MTNPASVEQKPDVSQRTRDHASFLAQASAALADSLAFETTLNTVAGLAVPGFADSCTIHLIDDDGTIRLVAGVHVDPVKAIATQTLANPETSGPCRVWLRTIREGVPALLADITPETVNQTLQDDERLLRAFEEVRFTSQISVPLRARGRTIGGITFLLGPGERRYDDVDLRLAEDLAQRAAIAVDNARLYRAAQDANRLKDEFLGTLSHELRTPLNAILGYARMLRDGVFTDPAKQARAIATLERNAQLLTHLVEDVLDVSRIMSGKLRLTMQPTDLAAVIEHAVETILPDANAKRLTVTTTIHRGAPPILGHVERLQQVVGNLLTNAVKFTPAGGAIEVHMRHDGAHAEIVVSDTGHGIAPGFLPHLFERFRQADSRISREHGGLGLGLAIAREIVQMHGGTIHAASAGEGRGATFTVRLPAVGTAPSPVGRVDSHVAPSAAKARRRLDGVCVLIVDDDPDSRELVQTIIEEAGATVVTADSAARALQRLDESVPDVMITDLGMPGMDGLALVQQVRRRPDAAAAVPAVALTAYARSEDRVKALACGFQAHLPKPVDHAQLVATVVALVAERRAGV